MGDPRVKPRFLVSWQIDIWADTPEKAARLALEIQRNPDCGATLFHVEPWRAGIPMYGIDELIDAD